jgi:VRR-NUC domain
MPRVSKKDWQALMAGKNPKEKTRKKPADREHQEQKSFFGWAQIVVKGDVPGIHIPELRYAYAVPNGGKRHIGTASKMKLEGVKKGVPDICIPIPRNGYPGQYIEMKDPKKRPKPRGRQVEWINELRRLGYQVDVCYGCREAQIAFLKYYYGPEFFEPTILELEIHKCGK